MVRGVGPYAHPYLAQYSSKTLLASSRNQICQVGSLICDDLSSSSTGSRFRVQNYGLPLNPMLTSLNPADVYHI